MLNIAPGPMTPRTLRFGAPVLTPTMLRTPRTLPTAAVPVPTRKPPSRPTHLSSSRPGDGCEHYARRSTMPQIRRSAARCPTTRRSAARCPRPDDQPHDRAPACTSTGSPRNRERACLKRARGLTVLVKPLPTSSSSAPLAWPAACSAGKQLPGVFGGGGLNG